MADQKHVLILSSAETAELIGYNNEFVDAVGMGLGNQVSVEWHHYRDIRIDFETGKIQTSLLSTGKQIDSFDFVYFKSYFRYAEQAAAVAACLHEKHVRFVSSELLSYLSVTKLTQFVRLAQGGMPIAPTTYMPNERYVEHYDEIITSFGSPFIFKATNAKGGADNYLIHSKSELEDALNDTEDKNFVAQQFIENEYDLRVLVAGEQVRMVIKRSRSTGTHLNNTSQGARAELLDVSEISTTDQKLALRAAGLMKREIAGVDLMFERGTGRSIILEVNASPQVATGAYTEEKIAVYCELFQNMLK